MNRNEIEAALRETISKVFSIPTGMLPETPDQTSVGAWDSLGHLRLILAVESRFGIRFPTDRIPLLNSLATLAKEIENVRRPTT